jgi:hypothetical protein
MSRLRDWQVGATKATLARLSPFWLLTASPLGGVAAWLWVGVHHHALLLRNSGSAAAADQALATGIVACTALAAAVLLVPAVVIDRRRQREAARAALISRAAQAAVEIIQLDAAIEAGTAAPAVAYARDQAGKPYAWGGPVTQEDHR